MCLGTTKQASFCTTSSAKCAPLMKAPLHHELLVPLALARAWDMLESPPDHIAQDWLQFLAFIR